MLKERGILNVAEHFKCSWLEMPLEGEKKKKSFSAFFTPQWTPTVCGECPQGARVPTEIMGSSGAPADTRTKNYSQSLLTEQMHNKLRKPFSQE